MRPSWHRRPVRPDGRLVVPKMFQSGHGPCVPPPRRRAVGDRSRCHRRRCGAGVARTEGGRRQRRPERPPGAAEGADHVHQEARTPVEQPDHVARAAAARGRHLEGASRTDSWRAGSGLPGGRATNSCVKGHGWLPNGRYSLRQYDDYAGNLIHGRAFRLSDKRCANGTLREQLFIHTEAGRRQPAVRQRAGRPDLPLGVPEDQRLHLPRLHQDVARRHPGPDPRLPPLLPARRPVLHCQGLPPRPLTADLASLAPTSHPAEMIAHAESVAKRHRTRRVGICRLGVGVLGRDDGPPGESRAGCRGLRAAACTAPWRQLCCSNWRVVVSSVAGAGADGEAGVPESSSPSTTSRCLET